MNKEKNDNQNQKINRLFQKALFALDEKVRNESGTDDPLVYLNELEELLINQMFEEQ